MDLITEIKSKIQIIDLVRSFGLIPNGSNKINSIYKEDRTPSLQLYPKTNSFYCFATSKGGDVIQFYEDIRNISRREAVRELADQLNISSFNNSSGNKTSNFVQQPSERKNRIELLESEKDYFHERAAIYEIENGYSRDEAEDLSFDYILDIRREIQYLIYDKFYNYCIKQGFNDEALEYLKGKSRGLTAETIQKFKLFNISNVSKTIQFLKDSFTKDRLIISGLFTKSDYFVFSKHTIVIPFVERGRIVYLRGRYFFNGNPKPQRTGKYIGLHNFSTNLISKRFFNQDVLSGLPAFSKIFITEGEFDCMIASQSGLTALGVLGVANFPANKTRLLKNYRIYLVFDSDEAGEKAVKKVGELFEQPIYSIKLNNFKDLTELVING